MKEQVQEIDLMELFLKGIKFIRSHTTFLIIACISGMVFSLIPYFILPEKFKQELIGYSPVLAPSLIEESLNDITKLDYLETISTTNKDSSLIKTIGLINSIKVSEIITPKQEMLKIEIKSTSKLMKDDIVKVINHNLESNKYVHQSLEIKIRSHKDIIKFIEKEIKSSNENYTLKGNVIVKNDETPSTLFIRKKLYEEELEFLKPFIITKATGISSAQRPSTVGYMIAGGVIGVIVLLLFYFLRYLNRLTLSTEKNKS